MLIDKEQFQEWLLNPVTKEVKAVMQERRLKVAVDLAGGACLGNESEHGIAVGRVREINDYLEMNYEDLKGE